MVDLVVMTQLQQHMLAAGAMDLSGEPIEAHPLWFRPEAFLCVGFDLDAYVTELRSYVPLESLTAELRAHLAVLRTELVGLIHHEYTDFVGLSAKLKGVDAAVATALAALRAGLEQRAAATAARELLELLLDTSHVVSKILKT